MDFLLYPWNVDSGTLKVVLVVNKSFISTVSLILERLESSQNKRLVIFQDCAHRLFSMDLFIRIKGEGLPTFLPRSDFHVSEPDFGFLKLTVNNLSFFVSHYRVRNNAVMSKE